MHTFIVAQPPYASLNAEQKRRFADEFMRVSRSGAPIKRLTEAKCAIGQLPERYPSAVSSRTQRSPTLGSLFFLRSCSHSPLNGWLTCPCSSSSRRGRFGLNLWLGALMRRAARKRGASDRHGRSFRVERVTVQPVEASYAYVVGSRDASAPRYT